MSPSPPSPAKARKARILFVCMGNICRSPAAEGIFRKYVELERLGDVIACDSAGTLGSHAGERPDPRMIRAAAKRGYSLDSRARQFVPEDFDAFDTIVVMDRQNHKAVVAQSRRPGDAAKVVFMGDFHPEPDVVEIPDPYYGGPTGFEYVLDSLEVCARGLLEETIGRLGLRVR